MGLRRLDDTSVEFRHAYNLLASGWSGTYGQLATLLGRSSRSALLSLRVAESYARRTPGWDRSRVHKA